MKALILAAGMGTRLKDITKEKPKALVSVNGKCLIDRTLSFVNDSRISSIAIVTGFQADKIANHLRNRDKIKLFKNENFREGNISSLITGMDFITEDTLLLNVDHIYPKEMLDHVLTHSSGITAVCDFNRELTDDDMKVKLDDDNNLINISKELKDFDGGYIGMTFIGQNMIGKYKETVKATLKESGKNTCVEFVLKTLVNSGEKVKICDTSDYSWLEIDDQYDLYNAEQRLKKGQLKDEK